MNIDEFIEHTKEKAKEHRCHADFFESDNPMRTACTRSAEDCEWLADCLTKFKEYQQLEEQGRLIKLPCKVGDTVHVVTSPFNVFDDIEYDENMKDEVYESYVSSITFYECGEQYRIYAKATNHFIGAYFRECDFGKTVFLTESEAEAKLKEMEENQ
jgi:hypothetical protein